MDIDLWIIIAITLCLGVYFRWLINLSNKVIDLEKQLNKNKERLK